MKLLLNKKLLLLTLTVMINNLSCEDSTGQGIDDKIWDKFSKTTGIGGYHKENNFGDSLKKAGICEKNDSYEGCLAILFVNYDLIVLAPNQTDIQIKNSSSYSRITFTFKDQVVVLNASEISKVITVPFDPVGLYKIETTAGVIFQNSSFNFRGSLKDGVIIREDAVMKNDWELSGCNLINVETGKIETVGGQCLTPTNP